MAVKEYNMGQYRQWLHYRTIDQQLRSQLSQLEQELTLLQERARLLEQESARASNPIIQALAAWQQRPQEQSARQNAQQSMTQMRQPKNRLIPERPLPPVTPAVPAVPAESASHLITPAEPATERTDTISAAGENTLQTGQTTSEPTASPGGPEAASFPPPDWNSLPAFYALELPASKDLPFKPSSLIPLPALPATPVPDAPLSPAGPALPGGEHGESAPQLTLPPWLRNAFPASQGPTDQQSVRTNKLVQRWIERWGQRESQQPEQPEQDRSSEVESQGKIP
ncbi:MAG: hypothetical protein IMW89_01655 [Ktedonobacteraceae bacterium]|nr:hypothetical protein [Ktedonobacteraceae bacterium]